MILQEFPLYNGFFTETPQGNTRVHIDQFSILNPVQIKGDPRARGRSNYVHPKKALLIYTVKPMSALSPFLQDLLGNKARPFYQEEGHPPRLVDVSTLGWSERLKQGFKHPQLYSHQADCYQAMRAGEHVVITTPTASGKTGAFLPAIVQNLLDDPNATALLVYPLVALAQDQREKLQAFLDEAGILWLTEEFQGQATVEKAFREGVRIVMATPDKLHWALANPRVALFLKHLKHLVLDEAHTYRGGFGCEISGLIRRVLALSEHLGAKPQVVLSTATIGNATEFAESLTGLEFTEINTSGAKKCPKTYYLVDHRGQARKFWDNLINQTLVHGQKTLVFFRGRSKASRMHAQYHNRPEYRDFVHLYMSGAGARDARLSRFREARSGVMFATSALEAGVDIGDLSVVVLDGYPGSRMTFRQMVGRAGRIDEGTILYLPAMDEHGVPRPADAFYSNPQNFRQLLQGAVERAVIEAHNNYITPKHLSRMQHEFYAVGLNPPEQAAGSNWALGMKRWNLRSDDGEKYYVVERELWESNPKKALFEPLETPSGHYAHAEKHIGAVFSWDGIGYQVSDWLPSPQGTVILVEKTPQVGEFTRGNFRVKVTPVKMEKWETRGDLAFRFGEVSVQKEYLGYQLHRQVFARACPKCDHEAQPEEKTCPKCNARIRDRVLEQKLAEHTFEAPLTLPSFRTCTLEIGVKSTGGTAHALKHALIKLIPELVACDPNDIAGAFRADKDNYFFIYDDWKGGLGISHRAYKDLPLLLDRALELCSSTCCENGCYQCLEVERCGSPTLENGENRHLNKTGAREFLENHLGKKVRIEAAPLPEIEASTLNWELQARELLELQGLSSTEVSKRLGIPSREFQNLPSSPLRVMHPKFGEGILISAIGYGSLRKAKIRFPTQEKTFLVALAPIQVIG